MKLFATYALIAFLTVISEGISLGLYETVSTNETDWINTIPGSVAYVLIMHGWLYPIPTFLFTFINKWLPDHSASLLGQLSLGVVIAGLIGGLTFPQLYRFNWLSSILCAPVGGIWGLLHWTFVTRPRQLEGFTAN